MGKLLKEYEVYSNRARSWPVVEASSFLVSCIYDLLLYLIVLPWILKTKFLKQLERDYVVICHKQ